MNDKQFISILDKLVYHEFLEKQGSGGESEYKNSNYCNKYFTEQSERNYSYVYSDVDRLIKKFPMVEENMKNGNLINILDEFAEDRNQLRNFADFYTIVNQRSFANLVKNFDFSRYKTVIDTFGKKGDLCMKIKEKYPDVQVISYDIPALEPLCIEHLKLNKMEDKVELSIGDIRKDKPTPSDVVIITHLLQYFEYDSKKNILKSIYSSLNPNGVLIIMENLIYETKKEIEIPANKISFLLSLEGYEGEHLTFEEYSELLSDVGFKEIKKHHRDWISCVIVCVKKENGEDSKSRTDNIMLTTNSTNEDEEKN